MTVLEVISRSSEFLARKGVDSPRLQTELLLAHVLKLPRMKLYLDFERKLAEPELNQLRELVLRRSQREPLQHLTGSTSFCGIEIAVSKHVLVPRPETELLAELGWKFLSTLNSQPSTCLDFGTGSGCIAIVLAMKCPTAQVIALDVSAEALAVAQQNAETHQVGGRIHFLHGDGFAALADRSRGRSPRQFDLIISNPPYIARAEIASLDPEVRDHDPRLALDGGVDGLDFYRRLAVDAPAFLKSDGQMMVELGDGQAEAARQIFEKQNWIVETVTDDYAQRARILTTRR